IVRTSAGYDRRVSNIGFYWAMSDYSDATFAFDWWSNRYTAATGNIRYNWLQQFLRGDASFRQYWRESGGSEIAFDTRNNWEYDERTRLNMTARYASSSNFVRQNSFDPREVTQSINSTAGLSRRFDWGTLTASGNRQQHLSDDRVEMTLPTVNLSLSPITFFSAPPGEAGWLNNITWSGSSNFSRRTVERLQLPDQGFSFARADEAATRAGVSSSLNVGALTWSQNAQYDETIRPSVPDTLFPGIDPPLPPDPDFQPGLQDLGVTNVSWSSALSFRQRLIGTTTLTPRVSISGQAVRSDTIPEAASFVSGPNRITFGAGLQTDIFGFYPGIGDYSAIRHKLTPTASYNYTPPSQPTALQQSVFGSQELQARSQVTIGLNQTFEAKVSGDAPESAPAEGEEAGVDETEDEGAAVPAARAGEPRRAPQDRIVNLLALRTQAVTYDFVRADTLGFFTGGFVTTRLQNQVSSDYLRGLTLSMEHDLFSEQRTDNQVTARSFAPHLSQLNFSFSVSNRTALFQRLFGGGAPPEPEETVEDEEEEDVFAPREGFDELRMMPTRSEDAGRGDLAPRRSPLGEWSANLSYSLRRPRALPDAPTGSRFRNAQMVQATVSFKPTENWDVNWRTSYDIERGTFNDHMIRLSRDLHEWEASFDFRQTATGNWSFRFEVSLIANRDLKFDFEQRNLDAGLSPGF
ncbi:MAG: putative LPS assembly protein LptD, partial [Gemmatimonadota bacterium]